jgi:sortase A
MLRWFGRICIFTAAVLAGYLFFLHWDTDRIAAHAQDTLRQEFNQQHRGSGPKADASTELPGQAYADLVIPKIHLDVIVVQGTDTASLTHGPGHYPGSANPWDAHGEVAIAGHRTTYLHPFWNLDQLGEGDEITLVTHHGTFTYSVTRVATVSPGDVHVTDQTPDPTLVLTTCPPRFSASNRLVVFATRN